MTTRRRRITEFTKVFRSVDRFGRALVRVAVLLTFFPIAASAQDNTLSPDEQLGPNDYLISSNGRYRFTNQGDGTMAVTVEGYVVWSLQRGVGSLVMQGIDGNLVLYGDGGSVLWSSETNAGWKAGGYLVMQDDGNRVLYRAEQWPSLGEAE